jgi:hypothetical protein
VQIYNKNPTFFKKYLPLGVNGLDSPQFLFSSFRNFEPFGHKMRVGVNQRHLPHFFQCSGGRSMGRGQNSEKCCEILNQDF